MKNPYQNRHIIPLYLSYSEFDVTMNILLNISTVFDFPWWKPSNSISYTRLTFFLLLTTFLLHGKAFRFNRKQSTEILLSCISRRPFLELRPTRDMSTWRLTHSQHDKICARVSRSKNWEIYGARRHRSDDRTPKNNKPMLIFLYQKSPFFHFSSLLLQVQVTLALILLTAGVGMPIGQ